MRQQLQSLLDKLCGLLCAAALFAIMVLTFFDVGGRKLLSNSIPGSLELTELLMVIVIFAGLPLVSERGEHVVFDSLDMVWPAWVVKLQKALVHLLCATLMFALAVLMFKTGMQFAEYGETTAQLKIPKSPFIFGMAAFCAVTALVHAVLALWPRAMHAQAESAAL
ncbi:MAG: TRAP transporter small permease [Brachymonas sp.]|nr:TRAP transporter small permease [Brachymonas sp.]